MPGCVDDPVGRLDARADAPTWLAVEPDGTKIVGSLAFPLDVDEVFVLNSRKVGAVV